MTTYQAPQEDFQFLLNHVFDAQNKLFSLPKFNAIDEEVTRMVLQEGAKVCEEVLHPINQSGDQEACQFDAGKVKTPKGFKEAYQTYTQAGWSALSLPGEYGGQDLPETFNFMLEEMACSANTSFSLYPVLTRGVVNVLVAYASDELKACYLEQLVAGSWSGTMCLTESHAGTDLGLIKTRAEPKGQKAYALTGSKIFITGGEHDLTENIIHLVLARLPDAPQGVKGISLFLVPKYFVNDDGSLGGINAVSCGAIEHKMGIKASSTCVMNFDGATGFLVGEANKGLSHMFTLMNMARLGIGLQGLGLGEVAYQNARTYALERLQSRSLTGVKNASQAADPIIVHPDVRRILMSSRAYLEGCRALSVWTAMQLDISHHHHEASARIKADDMVDLMTPVFKAFMTDVGYEVTTQCQQVFGGHGYIQETGVEQFVRDARIAQIYEGTNGIQALDLVRRKLFIHDGRLALQFFELMESELNSLLQKQPKFAQSALDAVTVLRELTTWLVKQGVRNPDELGAASVEYLRVFALTTLAWLWAKMADAALAAEQTKYTATKLATAEFYFARVLPQTTGLYTSIRAGSACMMKLDAKDF